MKKWPEDINESLKVNAGKRVDNGIYFLDNIRRGELERHNSTYLSGWEILWKTYKENNEDCIIIFFNALMINLAIIILSDNSCALYSSAEVEAGRMDEVVEKVNEFILSDLQKFEPDYT